MTSRKPLPIDAFLPEIVAALGETQALVLEAAPGTGKTTRVPPALLDHFDGQIVVLEPRRVAARLSAERIASELGEPCGERVGYQIRFESKTSARTRLRFLTEGLFLRLFLEDPSLSKISCVVLDEFHERHIHTDVALAMVRFLQKTVRPDLRLVVMSATLDKGPLESFLGQDSRTLVCPGTVHPVEIEYRENWNNRPLESLVDAAVRDLLRDARCPGHVLVFLPGAADIRRAARVLSGSVGREPGVELLELRSELPRAEQDKVFAPSPDKRKIILSTNIAETSVTIDNVTGVVDSGLAKVSGQSSWSGIQSLKVRAVSKASCIQRAGRAGRTAPGVCIRLFGAYEFQSRLAVEKPEILRSDLTSLLLEMTVFLQRIEPKVPGASLARLEWLDPPPEDAWSAARETLRLLGAISASVQDAALDRATDEGVEMARYPLHPRLSKILTRGRAHGCESHALLAASLLNEGLLFRTGGLESPPDESRCDVCYQMRLFQRLAVGERLPGAVDRAMDPGAFHRIRHATRNLAHLASRVTGRDAEKGFSQEIDEKALTRCFLDAFPDRVAKRRVLEKRHQSTRRLAESVLMTLCTGGSCSLAQGSVVQHYDYVIALDAEERSLQGAESGQASVFILVASGLEADELIYSDSPFVQDAEIAEWDEASGRVRGFERISYGKLVLEERQVTVSARTAEDMLARQLRSAWPKPFDDVSYLDYLRVRARLLRQAGLLEDSSQGGGDLLEGEDFDLLLLQMVEGKRSFAQIAERPLKGYVDDVLPPELLARLTRDLPETMTLPSGRRVTIHYEPDKEPWVASRLQDFFGLTKNLSLLQGRLPVVVHLLAPNGRAVQVTKDLVGFWTNGYQDVRKELCRRYPRHAWPDDPRVAVVQARKGERPADKK